MREFWDRHKDHVTWCFGMAMVAVILWICYMEVMDADAAPGNSPVHTEEGGVRNMFTPEMVQMLATCQQSVAQLQGEMQTLREGATYLSTIDANRFQIQRRLEQLEEAQDTADQERLEMQTIVEALRR